MRKLLILSFILILLSINIFSAEAQQVNTKYHALVERIIDGDTLKIFINGKRESLRLIGIDAPESRKNKKAYRDAKRNHKDIETIIAMGHKSTQFVSTLIKPGDKITVEFDVQLRDKYGRLLGYVYLKDGEMLNESILRAGYAALKTIPPDVKYVSRLYEAYLEARKYKRGLWNY